MRNRIKVSGTLVTSSGKSSTIVDHSPIKDTKRIGQGKVTRQLPKNVGQSTYSSFMILLKIMHPKDWAKRLEDASNEIDKEFSKGKGRVIGTGTRVVRKGYTTQVCR